MKVSVVCLGVALIGVSATHGPASLSRAATVVESSDASLAVVNGVQFNNGALFSGVVRERFDGGGIKRETPYVNGKRDGTGHGWYDTGAPRETRRYRAGLEEGTHRGWYANGARRFVYHYANGRGEGLMEEWYDNGQPYTRFEYVLGQEEGRQRMWTEYGLLRANYVVDHGRRYGLMGTTGCTDASMPDSVSP